MQDGTVIEQPADAPVASGRAIAFGMVAASVGIGGHVLVAGAMPHPLLALVALVGCSLVGWALAAAPRSFAVTAAVLVAAQLGIHGLCLLDGPETTAASIHAGHTIQEHAAHTAASTAAGGQPLLMLLVHMLAVAFAAAVLHRLDQRAWRSALRVIDGVRAVLRRFVAASRIADARCTATRIDVVLDRPRAVALRRCVPRRGPPVTA